MTLIITELSEFGIAMVADSAATLTVSMLSGNEYTQVLNGVEKLQVIPYLNAGISMWGLGEIPVGSNSVPTDIWIKDFIQQHSHVSSIDEFASELAKQLQQAVGDMREPSGFHLAGYVEQGEHILPTLYHVRNVDGDYTRGYEQHEFIAGQDFPPRALNPGETFQVRNGSYGPFAILDWAVKQALPIIKAQMSFDLPAPSLGGRTAYFAAWIKFVSDLYASSDLYRSIGGTVTTLQITPGRCELAYY